jgi:hypothetical protein
VRNAVFAHAAALLLLLVSPAAIRADEVLDWNEVLLDAIRTDRTPPPVASRAMAIVHVSMYDAVNGIYGDYTPYFVTAAAPPGASAEAAAVEAAHHALTALFPAQVATFDAARTASLAAIPDGSAKNDGIAWGNTVADAILLQRADDGAGDAHDYSAPLGGGWWAPTAPAFGAALLPNWPYVTPWCLGHGSDLRADAPPFPTSGEYTAAFNEVRRLGRLDSAHRTADQTQVALFWADGPGTETPPGHWLVIAAGVSQDRGLSLRENARLFGLLSLTVADAAIVAWDHKYAFSNWRPIAGIQHADLDGNPSTVADPAWLPLIATPPFPSYSSGHSTFSASSARLLAHFFGTDAVPFSTGSGGLPGVTRSFDSFSQAADEAGQSRIYGGIHWQFDNTVGLASGRQLADHVFYGFMTPVAHAGTCSAGPEALCLGDQRFLVEAHFDAGDGVTAAEGELQGTDSGRFWFFDEDNTELVVKVLDGCAYNQRYWVFVSGLTNVEVTLTVTDRHNGVARRYFNAQGKAFAPVQDVDAFATCP